MSAPTCREIRPRLSAHLEDDLEPGAARETLAHVMECAACRAELEMLRRTVSALRSLPDLPPPAGILDGVRARLQPAPWYRRVPESRRWLFGIPVGALATLLVVIGLSFFQARHPEMQQTLSRAPGAPAVPDFLPAPAPPAPPVKIVSTPPAGDTAPAVESERPSPKPQVPSPRMRETAQETKSAEKERLPVAGLKSDLSDDMAAAAPAPAVESTSLPALAGRARELPEGVSGSESLLGERPATAPSRFVIPEPEPARTAALNEDPVGGPEANQSSPFRRKVGMGTLEGKPRAVTTLKDEDNDASAQSRTKTLTRGVRSVGPGEQALVISPFDSKEYRTLGTTASADRSELPGMVALHSEGRKMLPAIAPLRIVCLLLPNGATVESLARVLRREGATGVEIVALDRRALREASAAYHTRTDIAPGISRGWTVTARIPGWALPGLLDALSGNNGLRVLEKPPAPPASGEATGLRELRVTVLR